MNITPLENSCYHFHEISPSENNHVYSIAISPLRHHKVIYFLDLENIYIEYIQEQNRSSDIEQQSSIGDSTSSNTGPITSILNDFPTFSILITWSDSKMHLI